MSCCPIHIRANISIHAPPRGATLRANRHVVRLDDFNSRPSSRGDTFFISRPCFIGLFQFTPLREGRHVSCGCFNGTIDISIHAPPRGATRLLRDGHAGAAISIHAPPRGATRSGLRSVGGEIFQFTPLREGRLGSPLPQRNGSPFQFTPLREGRRFRQLIIQRHQVISIHAPPRGATCLLLRCRQRFAISIHAPPRGATLNPPPPRAAVPLFQFTPLREGRQRSFARADLHCEFQFTPLREGRLHRRSSRKPSGDFNSRPSARGDRQNRVRGAHVHISIHAPPRGATGNRLLDGTH